MPELLRMPEVAANTTEAVLLRWPVPVNAPFRAHDTIAMVETAKAVVDVEAERDGVLLATLVAEGAEVEIGAPIALLGMPGEQVADLDAALAAIGVEPPGEDAKAARVLEVPGADHEPPAPSLAALPATAQLRETETGRTFVSPLARRLARDAGLTLEEIAGTGPNHRILRRDVEAAIARHAASLQPAVEAGAGTVAAGNGYGGPPRSQVLGHQAKDEAYTDNVHGRPRRAIAERLLESKLTTPHFYLRGRARVDALLQLRADLNDGAPVRVSLNDLLIKAVAQAHLRVPEMNVIWMPDAVRSFSAVDVGVAIDTDAGLVTPVLRNVGSRAISDVARATADFAVRARARALRQHELEGGSITVTNLGMFGTEEFAAIINPPQAAILAVGAVTTEPIVEDGGFAVASIMRLTLSVDHRPIDGVTAARWMRTLTTILEKPAQILA